MWGQRILLVLASSVGSPSASADNRKGVMAKVKVLCLKTQTFGQAIDGVSGLSFNEGAEYSLPSDFVKNYPDIFKSLETKKVTKKATTQENK